MLVNLPAKVKNSNSRTKYEIFSQLTIKTTMPWRHSSAFTVNFEHILHLVLVFLLFTLNMYLPAEFFLDTESTGDFQKTSRTSSERFSYVYLPPMSKWSLTNLLLKINVIARK